MKNLILFVYLFLAMSIMTSCSKETAIKDDIETGILCDLDLELNYSEWCIPNRLKYHIGYPDITCFDSMLISFPVVNDLVSQYGNPPFKADWVFNTYFKTIDQYRIEGFDCFEDGVIIRYYMFIKREDLLDPSEVNVLFYFFEGNASLPTDSLEVDFKPWN